MVKVFATYFTCLRGDVRQVDLLQISVSSNFLTGNSGLCDRSWTTEDVTQYFIWKKSDWLRLLGLSRQPENIFELCQKSTRNWDWVPSSTVGIKPDLLKHVLKIFSKSNKNWISTMSLTQMIPHIYLDIWHYQKSS